jgi:hypothetical protein
MMTIVEQDQKYSASFNRRPFTEARRDIRDLVSIPVLSWVAFSRPHKTTEAYRALLDIPMDLASAGFAVTVTQGDQGWAIEIEKAITEDVTLHLHGSARSDASALFQIAQDYDTAIDDLQRKARKAWDAAREAPAA